MYVSFITSTVKRQLKATMMINNCIRYTGTSREISKKLLLKQQSRVTGTSSRYVASSNRIYDFDFVDTQNYKFSSEALNSSIITGSNTSSSSSSSSHGGKPFFSLEVTPTLQKVPSLPYVGSLISLHSGMPERRTENEFDWMIQMRQKYGDFHVYGLPGMGTGTHGLVYTVSDPREYMKVIRHEGKFPFGMVQLTWTLEKFFTETDVSIVRGTDKGFLGRGEKWKTIRTFLQTDLLSPQAASGYIPGVIQAAELASKGAQYITDDVNSYLNRCTFDMFMTVMLGELTQVANSQTQTDPVNIEFIANAAKFLGSTTNLITNLPEILMAKVFNHRSVAYKGFHEAGEKVLELSRDKVRQFKQQYETGTLNELQKQSYLANAIQRQQNQVVDTNSDTYITEEIMIDVCALLLIASVDTTSSVLSFALGHIALSSTVQEKLYNEIKTNMTSKETGRLTADLIESRTVAPYLHAVLRESHRLTPSAGEIVKEVSSEITIHGTTLPANSRIAFNAYAVQMDPVYVDNPEKFYPERWLPDAVAARKGTPKEIIDHPFYKDPFSQGARKCPGSRVAVNEILALLSQLVLDYKINTPPEVKTYRDIPYTLMGAMAAVLPKLEFVPRN